MKIIWRIEPGISQTAGAGKQKPCWLLSRIQKNDGAEISRSFGAFDTIKAAKTMAAHLKRKPIELQ
jgi:hypothetical protein